MILYPTETIYGLGVNVLDDVALQQLFALKGRDESQTVSWAVRDLADVERFAELSETAQKLAEQFLPGPLTLVLPAKTTVPPSRQAPDRTVGFRIPGDVVAQRVVAEFMATHDAPLTCTSANISGQPPADTTEGVLAQFGSRAEMIETVIDDGRRAGAPSTVVRVVGDELKIIREGSITADVLAECT